ncbi:hypothetical protein PR002_g2855 [Phytophthora rubi]|uniref:C2H2-type domain-containing protein n=1 Tax=Phytophthora rubi TaxID=129364 RepID=A0A6A3NT19_9STRA|nr:hypothetical protein PR002_g2855 [Phytophthora rubi]
MKTKKVKKVSEWRSYEPRNDMLDPNAVELAAGVVSPLDVPVDSRIPYLRYKNVRGRRAQMDKMRATRRRNNRLVMELGGFAYEVHRTVARLSKNKRRKSTMGLPVNDKSPLGDTSKLQDMDEEFLVKRNRAKVCKGTCCNYLRWYGSSTTGLQPYTCFHYKCRIAFESFTELFEHQLDVHGQLMPRNRRTVADVFRQQRGKLAYPPPTVYLGQQYMCPGCPPTPWQSMDQVHEEAKDLRRRLQIYLKGCRDFAFLWKMFKEGYEKVKRNGQPEMDRQYQMAMEHYYAAFKFQASSRGFHDGCPSVETGRNWLTSTEREDARYLHPFSLNDKVTAEPEFVLIDTKRDEEMWEVSSDGSDADGDEDESVSEGKIVKLDEDEEMKSSEAGDVKERKVFEADSDSEDEEMKSSEAGDVKERKVFEVDSDSDDDVAIKSECVESDAESKPSRTSATGDSASDEDDEEEEKNEEDKKNEKDHASSRNTGRGTKAAKGEDDENDTELNSSAAGDTNSVSDSDSDDEAEEDEIFNDLE